MNTDLLAERYKMGRIRWIAAVAAGAAAIAFLTGNPQVAWGAILATPVGMLNYYLMVRAMRPTGERPQVIQGRILKYSLIRMMLSAATLFIAFGFGPLVMLGALIGVVSEMFTYMGDTVRMIRQTTRGDK